MGASSNSKKIIENDDMSAAKPIINLSLHENDEQHPSLPENDEQQLFASKDEIIHFPEKDINKSISKIKENNNLSDNYNNKKNVSILITIYQMVNV